MCPGVWDVCSGPVCDWSVGYACVDVAKTSYPLEQHLSRVWFYHFLPKDTQLKERLQRAQWVSTQQRAPCIHVTPSPEPHGLSDGFSRVLARLILSPPLLYRPSLIPVLDNINANRRLFSHPSTQSGINRGEGKQRGGSWMLPLSLRAEAPGPVMVSSW